MGGSGAEVDRRGLSHYIAGACSMYGWKVKDSPAAGLVAEGLFRNLKEHGAPYCPCRLTRNHEDICPCADAASDIAEKGHCKCQLFVSASPIKQGDV